MIKAIETNYKGCKFRSRLEARWAVFFDSLGLKWEYEKEGYVLNETLCYLPDFYLPGLGCFLEIKGSKPNQAEKLKAELLSKLINKKVFISFGKIPFIDELIYSEGSMFMFTNGGFMDNNYNFCECPKCGKIGIEYEGRADRIGCDCKKSSYNEDKGYNNFSSKLAKAYKAALSARFEFKSGASK